MNNSRYFSSTPPVVAEPDYHQCVDASCDRAAACREQNRRGAGAFQRRESVVPFLPVVTYMFLHGGFSHLFFNMFALWMFGRTLEYELGSKRFLTYYMVCGVGAGVLQLLVGWLEYRYGNVGMMA